MPPTKRKPRQPLREPLNEDEIRHVKGLIAECQHKSTTKKLQWYGQRTFKSVAVTNRTGPRCINFECADGVFEYQECRNILDELVYGNNEESDFDDELDEGLIDIDEENFAKTIHVFGFVHFINSNHILLFFTAERNIFVYIQRQLENILQARGCPSWLRAIVTDRQKIDWHRIRTVTLTEGYTASLRLKLATVYLIDTPCYNVRTESFVAIRTGRDQYFKALGNLGVTMDTAAVQKMLQEANADEDTDTEKC